MKNKVFKDPHFIEALNEFSNKSIPAKQALKFMQIYKQLNEQKVQFESKITELVHKYCVVKPDNSGFQIIPEKLLDFQSATEALEEQEFLTDKIDFKEIESIEISTKHLYALHEIINL
jgi:hypothetical protein